MAVEFVTIVGADGTSAYIAGDVVAGVFYPVTKLDYGSDGASSSTPPLASGAATATAQTTNTTAVTGVTTAVTAVTSTRNTTPSASAKGMVPMFVRTDTLASISGEATNGNLALGRVDGNGATWTMQAGALDAAVDSIALGSSSYQGTDTYINVNLLATKVAVKATPGTLYGWYITNNNAAARYVKLWDLASASVTVGTTAPKLVFEIPGNATGTGSNMAFAPGIAFGTAITIAAVTGQADNNSTAPTANDLVVNLFYK